MTGVVENGMILLSILNLVFVSNYNANDELIIFHWFSYLNKSKQSW